MDNIEWGDGAVCFANKIQHFYDGDMGVIEKCAHTYDDFQLNEISQGDYIEASELETKQKYNDAVDVFGLFWFDPYLNRGLGKAEFVKHAIANSLGLIVDSDGDLVLDYNEPHDIKQRKRKITYPQLMAIGKLKRAMIERDKSNSSELPNSSELKSSDFESSAIGVSNGWSDEHYNHFYQLTEEDIKSGQIKVDAYFVNRMWKINSWEDTGAGFHILKTFPRIANNKNSLKRELVALKKQVDILCKLHGVDDDTN